MSKKVKKFMYSLWERVRYLHFIIHHLDHTLAMRCLNSCLLTPVMVLNIAACLWLVRYACWVGTTQVTQVKLASRIFQDTELNSVSCSQIHLHFPTTIQIFPCHLMLLKLRLAKWISEVEVFLFSWTFEDMGLKWVTLFPTRCYLPRVPNEVQ